MLVLCRRRGSPGINLMGPTVAETAPGVTATGPPHAVGLGPRGEVSLGLLAAGGERCARTRVWAARRLCSPRSFPARPRPTRQKLGSAAGPASLLDTRGSAHKGQEPSQPPSKRSRSQILTEIPR